MMCAWGSVAREHSARSSRFLCIEYVYETVYDHDIDLMA